MSTSVISFGPHGEGHCLYTEVIDLPSIGPLHIERATIIEFNELEQLWEVRAKEEVLFSNRSRAMCLAWEHQHFNR